MIRQGLFHILILILALPRPLCLFFAFYHLRDEDDVVVAMLPLKYSLVRLFRCAVFSAVADVVAFNVFDRRRFGHSA